MLKKRLLLLLVFMMITSLITACTTGNTDGNVTTPGSNDPAVKPQVPDKAEVTFSTIFSDEEFESVIGSYIKNKFPDYTIKHISNRGITLDEMIVAGTKFDIYFGRANAIVNDYDRMKLTYDMTELVKKHQVDLNAFAPGFVDSAKVDGKLYGLPIFNDSLVLFYNKELFDKFGVPYPKDGMTWEETLQIARQFDRNENGTQYMGLWMSPKHYFRMNSLSQGFVDPVTNKATIDNDNWKKIFGIFVDLSRNPGVREMAKQTFPSHDHFRGANRNTAMYVFITEWIAVSKQQMPLNWDMVSMPVFQGMTGKGTQPYANYAGITSFSENKDAAMQVLKYLTSDEYQIEISKIGKLSPLQSQKVRDAAFETHPDRDKNFGAVYVNDNVPMHQLHPVEGPIIDLMNDKITELVKGEKDINTALREAQEMAQQIIDQEVVKSK